MIFDLLFLIFSAAIALLLAFRSKAIHNAHLLVPVNSKKPIPERFGEWVMFRVDKLHQIRDRTVYKPKVFLAVLFFVLLALALKLIFFKSGDWSFFLGGFSLIIFLGLLVGGGVSNMFAIFLLLGLSFGVAWLFSLGSRGLGLCLGFVFGAYAGMFLSRNYTDLSKNLRLEIQTRKTREGDDLSAFSRIYRQFQLLFLIAVPFMIAQQVLGYWWPSLVVSGGDKSSLSSQYALHLLAFGLGMNIVFSMVPLFREMLEKTNVMAASDFTGYMQAWYRDILEGRSSLELEDPSSPEKEVVVKKSKKEVIVKESDKAMVAFPFEGAPKIAALPRIVAFQPSDRIKEFLGAKSQWLSFQQQQSFPILAVTLYLCANIVLQTFSKALGAGIIVNSALYKGFTFVSLIEVFSGIVWWANLTFLMGLTVFWLQKIARWLSQYSKQEAPEQFAQEINTELMWKATSDPSLQLYCYRVGSEPSLVLAPTDKNS